jgi:hypothetical protein
MFLQVLHSIVNDSVSCAENMLLGTSINPSDYLGGELTDLDIITLRSISFSLNQKKAFVKVLKAVCNLSITGALSVIDGIVMSDKFELPDLTLIERTSGKDIVGTMLLNEEFEFIREIEK